MSHQAQKRPFASLMAHDHDSDLADPLSPASSSSPVRADYSFAALSPQSKAHDPTPQLSPPAQQMAPHELAYCKKTLKALTKHKRAGAFLHPVDVVALNIPDYLQIIKDPIDLGTIESRLEQHAYNSVDAFLADVQRVFSNCYLYNGYTDPVALDAKKLEEVFDKWKAKRPQHTPEAATGAVADETTGNATTTMIPDDQFKRCLAVIKEMRRSKHHAFMWPFLEPVDAVAWGAFDYHDIIKHPMDLRTIDTKLQDFDYPDVDAFEKDIRLMFNNCYTYNIPEHDVYQHGKKAEKLFDTIWNKPAKAKKEKKAKKQKVKHVMDDYGYQEPLDAMDYMPTHTTATPPPASSWPPVSSAPALPIHLPLLADPTSNSSAVPMVTDHEAAPPPPPPSEPPSQPEAPAPPRIKLRLKLPARPVEKSSDSDLSTPATSESSGDDTQKPALALGLSDTKRAENRPRLAIGTKSVQLNDKQPSKKAPVVLQNESMWHAIAEKAKSQEPETPLSITSAAAPSAAHAHSSHTASQPATQPPASASAAPAFPSGIKRAASLGAPAKPKAPAKVLDLNELVGRIHNKDRPWEQSKKQKEEEATRLKLMEARQQSVREQEDQRREQREWMDMKRRRDQSARLNALQSRTIDISKQKLSMMNFEHQEMSRDPEFHELQKYLRHTIDYRSLPMLPSIKKRHNIEDLREMANQLTINGKLLKQNNSIQFNHDPMDFSV
ncbi:Bromodomain-containing protein [Gongronella butleri]|nr:Bromodomain-containing protein [Gongronella butleri]